jgi:two-component system chemotaxis response regulator CheY
MAKVLIADDRHLMRSALKTASALRPKWEICGEATDGREAVTKASELQPDLIIMDFKTPSDGIQAAREISATAPSIPIVMYTLYRTMNWMQRLKKQACRLLSRNKTASSIC